MIIKRDFIYTPKGKNRPLHIYLPDNYHETDECYPVMYFFDGHNLFDDADATYGKSWGMKAFLDEWSKNMIIVGIECGHEGPERLMEYLPYSADFAETGLTDYMGDVTLEWIIDEIKPMIDSEYRTYPFRECTGIGGSSMGGLMALYGVIHHNRWFSKGACISSAISFCMEPLMRDIIMHRIDPDSRFYLSWGTKEAHGIRNVWEEDRSSYTYWNHKKVVDELRSQEARVKMVCQVGGGHGEEDWEKLVPDFMSYLWLED